MFKLLIVDDSPYILKPLTAYFKDHGIDAVGCEDGASAITFLENNRVDVVLTDISMPELSGTEMMSIVRTKLRENPILVFMTGLTTHDPHETYLRGARAVLQKPMAPLDILEILKYFYNERKTLLEERNRAELDRLKVSESLNAAAFGEFAVNLVHEINHSVGIASGFSRRLSSELSEVISNDVKAVDILKMQTWAAKIDKNIGQIVAIIGGLRNWLVKSKEIIRQDADLLSLIKEALDLSLQKLQNLAINVEVPAEIEPKIIRCNPIQILQVLVNLVSNAADAIALLEIKTISIQVAVNNDYTEFSVTDSGPGIPKALREKVMLALFTTKEGAHGLGLGLNICKKIVADHHGDFFIDSECSNTKFVVRIPTH